MGIENALIKVGEKALTNTGSKALTNVATNAGTELLRNALVDVATKGGIDTASKGFGKQLLSGLKNKIYNSTAGEAQELINAFPALYRGDYGDVGNDLISALKNDGGAVLSAYASNPYFNMSKTPRTLGISRSSFDQFLSNPNNGILANARNEVIGSPRTSMLYDGGNRDAYDVLDQVRKSVMDTAEKNGTIGDLRSYSNADDYVSDLLEEIYSRSPRVNEIKMPLGPRSITSIKNFGEDAPRVLQNDARIALANGEMVNVPANSLFGNFEGLNANNPNSRALLSPDALDNNPREVIYSKLTNDYGADKAREIMAYYGGDIGKSTKSGKNSFLGRMLSGQEVENPLVMYHGVDKSKLRQMLDIADETYSDYALANPSLQVIDPTKNTGGDYGDIILLGNKTIPSSMDKYSGGVDYGSKYNLYSRDIYSPRKPEIVYNKGVPVIEGTRTRATPSNISDYMNKQGTKAVESNWTTPGSMAATQSKRLKSPLDAIKNSDLLKPEDELKKAFSGWDDEVADRVQDILDNYRVTTDPNINPYDYADYISSELQDAMAGKKGWDDPYGINTTDKGKTIVKELKDKASKLPTAYFEAKAKRAVPLKEFGGVILPEGFSDPRIEQALKDSGLEVLGRYDPNNYQESLGSTLRELIKGKDRLDTPYMLSKAEPDARYAKDTGRSLVEMHKRLMAMNKSRELDPNVKRIGNSAVAEVDTKTLPAGYEKVKKYLETSPNDVLYNALGVNLDDVDVSEWGDIIKNWIEEQGYEADKNVANNIPKVREIVAEQLAEELSLAGSPYAQFVQTRNALAKDNPGKGVGVRNHTISANDNQIYQTDAGKLDREYSERLGIGRSHTPMSDNAVAGDAQGVYFAGGIGVKPEFAQGETGVSTIAHERLHSWQNARRGQWDDRVIDAIDDLRGELKDFYHTKDQIKKYRKSGESLEYYANKDEQEARMLQSYLDNEGYTNTWKKNVADGTEWGDEVKPAFDKFYKKLRSLSKAGVALPAIAVLFGLNTNTGKKLDKKS